jgi:hypothetical protein
MAGPARRPRTVTTGVRPAADPAGLAGPRWSLRPGGRNHVSRAVGAGPAAGSARPRRVVHRGGRRLRIAAQASARLLSGRGPAVRLLSGRGPAVRLPLGRGPAVRLPLGRAPRVRLLLGPAVPREPARAASPGRAPPAAAHRCPRPSAGAARSAVARYRERRAEPGSRPGPVVVAAAGLMEQHPVPVSGAGALPSTAPARALHTDPDSSPAGSAAEPEGQGAVRGRGPVRGRDAVRGHCGPAQGREATGPVAAQDGRDAPRRYRLARHIGLAARGQAAGGLAAGAQVGERMAGSSGRCRRVRCRAAGWARSPRGARLLRSRSRPGQCAADRLSVRAGPPVGPTAEPALA